MISLEQLTRVIPRSLKGICSLEYCALYFIEWIILNQTGLQTFEEILLCSSIILFIFIFMFFTHLFLMKYIVMFTLSDFCVFMHLFLKVCMKG